MTITGNRKKDKYVLTYRVRKVTIFLYEKRKVDAYGTSIFK